MAEYEGIDKNDVIALEGLEKKIIADCEMALGQLDYLKSSIQNYKGIIKSAIDSNISYANIVGKYTDSVPPGSFNLPGVFANTVANYDIDAMKKDKEVLENASSTKETTSKQKELYYKMIVQNYNDLRQALNSLSNTNLQIFQYIEKLNSETN